MKIYTRTGDSGDTSLYDGTRVSKSDARIEACGEIDELNALLGAARASGVDPELDAILDALQRDLFALGARVADPGHQIAERVAKAALDASAVSRLEGWIDTFEASLPPLRRFILPGGAPAAATLHLSRTVCRRAERRLVSLGAGEPRPVDPRLRQSPLGPALRPRACLEPAGRTFRGRVVTIAEAYAACERLAAEHYENFPVASKLLPRAMRPHVAAVYAFARTADDFADEGERPERERHDLLDRWLARLRACVNPPGTALPERTPHEAAHDTVSEPRGAMHPPPDPGAIFLALGETIRVCRLPVGLFEDLIDAFRQDITTKRYATWSDVLDYCRRSANPVGRLVLRIAGYRDEALDRSSDAICTALQLTNFWQDLDRDFRRGRLYVPRADLERHGAAEHDLSGRALTPAWRHLLQELCGRTRALFDEGRPLCDEVAGRLGRELRFTWLGGCRILERLEQSGFDVFDRRPALGAADLPVLLWRAARWRRPAA